jgi:hypothetical protein
MQAPLRTSKIRLTNSLRININYRYISQLKCLAESEASSGGCGTISHMSKNTQPISYVRRETTAKREEQKKMETKRLWRRMRK